MFPASASTALRFPGALGMESFLLSSGCLKRMPLRAAHKARLTSTRAVCGVSQRALGVGIVRSSSGASLGLLGALADDAINNARLTAAEGAAWPVRRALRGYDPGAECGAALERELAALEWWRGGAVETRWLPDPIGAGDAAALLTTSPVDAVLLVQMAYRFDPTFEAIVVSAKAFLLSGAFDEEPSVLFTNTVCSASALTPEAGPRAELEALARRWADGQGRRARLALDTGAREVAQLIAYDLQRGDPAENYRRVPRRIEYARALDARGAWTEPGLVVRRSDRRTWMRLASGELCGLGPVDP